MSSKALPDVIAVAVDVTARLERIGVSYVIGGSLASSVHGEPRATVDIDIVADLSALVAPRLVEALLPAYYLDADVVRDAAKTGGSFNAIHTAAGIKVDFFVAGSDAFDLERLQSRIEVSMSDDPPHALWMDTAEHTLLRKLEWYRRGGEVSERQWRDVISIVAMQGDSLDQTELARWAPRLGVSDLLAKVMGDDR